MKLKSLTFLCKEYTFIRIISKPFDGGIVIKRFSEKEKESERRT